MRFLHFSFARLCSAFLLLSSFGANHASASSITIGTPSSSFAANTVDTCGNCSYILNQAFGTTGTLTSYTFNAYSYGDANSTGDLTPILLSGASNSNGATTFTITGVGTKRTEQNVSSNQTFDFGLTSGSNAVTLNSYFGWFDTNGALATFTYSGAGSGTFLFNGSDNVGRSFTLENTNQYGDTQNALDNRAYNINATAAVAVAPEPSSLALLGTGMAFVFGFARRRSA